MAKQSRLLRHHEPPLPLVQMREQHCEPQYELIANLVRYAMPGQRDTRRKSTH
jgi:hypothetical protein